MYPPLKEDVNSWQRDQVEVNRERNHGLDQRQYKWCPGCQEQEANCRCEEIRHREKQIAAWSRFQDAVLASEGIEEAMKEVRALGEFSESQMEASIKQQAEWKLQDEANERTKWFQDG